MSKFAYRNENTGDVVEYDYRSPRLEMLPNWVTLQEPEADEPQEPNHDPVTPPPPPAPTGPAAQEPQTPPDPGDKNPAKAEAGGDGNGPDAVPERPARAASKADWQAYARARAQDADEEAAVDGLTKDQLIETYGSDD
ncbi:hypothetical protein [Streptomyces cadmiisoli]|uniref:hypothetical protein n=1 Tax=Streptomyces cadmiisoli TaxID=2184053 RepID=UPI003D70F30D